MLDVTLAGWAATVGLVVALLTIDLGLAVLRPHRRASAKPRRGRCSTSAWRSASASCSGWSPAGTSAAEYFAGYVVEKSLSVDNLFVFVVIMTTFAVPAEHQQKVLIIGIVLALILRAIFIAARRGAAVRVQLHVPDLRPAADLHGGPAVPAPRAGPERRGQRDRRRSRAGGCRSPTSTTAGAAHARRRPQVFTPLFIVLIAIGSTDILFALDSIPAIFGVTQEAFIVFAANAFALLGLRALFFLVSGLLDRLVYLSTGLSLILAFIGVKLILHWAHEDATTSRRSRPRPR